MHRATKRFWRCYWELPEGTRNTADKAFALLKMNPNHPSLQFKKIGKFYSVRIGLAYRALALRDEAGYVWVWIGNHDTYDQLLILQ